jgi:hypothetical protein
MPEPKVKPIKLTKEQQEQKEEQLQARKEDAAKRAAQTPQARRAARLRAEQAKDGNKIKMEQNTIYILDK